jgi:hypothetical protein
LFSLWKSTENKRNQTGNLQMKQNQINFFK